MIVHVRYQRQLSQLTRAIAGFENHVFSKSENEKGEGQFSFEFQIKKFDFLPEKKRGKKFAEIILFTVVDP